MTESRCADDLDETLYDGSWGMNAIHRYRVARIYVAGLKGHACRTWCDASQRVNASGKTKAQVINRYPAQLASK